MQQIKITVPGSPVGKGRARAVKRGNFIAHYTPEKTVAYEALVGQHARAAMGSRAPIEGPVAVGIALHVAVPPSWPKRKQDDALQGRLRPTGKPDADNVIKALFDACNGIVWRDDAQVTDIDFVTKRYGPVAHSVLYVREAL